VRLRRDRLGQHRRLRLDNQLRSSPSSLQLTTRIPPIRFFPVEIRRGASRRGSKMSYQFDSIDGVEIQKGKPVVVKGWLDPKTNIMHVGGL